MKVAIMSHKRLDSLYKTVNYYRSFDIEPIVCDNTPDSFWSSSGRKIADYGCKFKADESFTFYDQLIWLSEYFLNTNQALISICPDEDLHYHRWFNYSQNVFKSVDSSTPVTCIYGPSLSVRSIDNVMRIKSAVPSRAFTDFDKNIDENAKKAMVGQVPFLWRTYPADFFHSLMKTVKWFGLKYGDKVTEQVIWNLLIPAMGVILQPSGYVHFIRKESRGLRFEGEASIGQIPFVKEMKNIDCKELAIELTKHTLDFPDRFVRPSQDLLEYCLKLALNVFFHKPWRFSRNDQACFYVDPYKKDSKFLFDKLEITGNETAYIFNYLIASALNMPVLALDIKDIRSISKALTD